MNIIDTRAEGSEDKDTKLQNVSLFKLKPVEYDLLIDDFTDVVFQSTPAVNFFNDHSKLFDKNIFSMGESTKQSLLDKGLDSTNPNIPGSLELNALIKNTLSPDKRFLIVKGKEGLSDISDFLKKKNILVSELICYERLKFKSYKSIKKQFNEADAIIFPSTFSAQIFFKEIYTSKLKASYFGISPRIIKYIKQLGYHADLIDYFNGNIERQIRDFI